jgi:hypothetical protein
MWVVIEEVRVHLDIVGHKLWLLDTADSEVVDLHQHYNSSDAAVELAIALDSGGWGDTLELDA